jgi:hypothetical protein
MEPKSDGILGAPFTDVPASAAYADAVAWAYQAGVVSGMTETAFSPDAGITREQITAMFYRYAKNVANADISISNDLSSFTDKDNIASWAADTMQWSVAAGLINGTTATTLTPQGTATRAQVAAMVERLANYTH